MIINGDSLDVLKTLEDNSVDTVITDPPYGYSFMGKDWDKAVPSVEIWQECLRVLKPGAFACVMSAPRSDVQQAMTERLIRAGFRLDFTPIYWTYASGFPKAMNIGKAAEGKILTGSGNKQAFQKLEGEKAARGNWGISKMSKDHGFRPTDYSADTSKERTLKVDFQTEEGAALDGSYAGFQPKPAVEVVIIAMKPLSEKTYVDQALKNGKGITWLDDCRVPTGEQLRGGVQNDIMNTCQCDPSNSPVESAEQSNPLREATNETKNSYSVRENVAMPTSEKIHGITQEDTNRVTTSCSDETSAVNTTVSSSMSGYGKENTEQSPKATKYTTSTPIEQTTDSKTCSVCRLAYINDSTKKDIKSAQVGTTGRFPANLLVSDDVLNDGVIRKSGGKIKRNRPFKGFQRGGDFYEMERPSVGADSGSYSRYFDLDAWARERLPAEQAMTFPFAIFPKASKSEKNKGLEGFDEKSVENIGQLTNSVRANGTIRTAPAPTANHHPTVKPLKLMSYLITLFSREGDTVLDPFVGSGTTAVAAEQLGRKGIGIEREAEYAEIARARVEHAKTEDDTNKQLQLIE